jgi:L-ribulose-5-phosphate 4-epimerase
MNNNPCSTVILAIHGTQGTYELFLEEVIAGIREGDIAMDQLVWIPSYNGWRRVEELPELNPSLTPTADSMDRPVAQVPRDIGVLFSCDICGRTTSKTGKPYNEKTLRLHKSKMHQGCRVADLTNETTKTDTLVCEICGATTGRRGKRFRHTHDVLKHQRTHTRLVSGKEQSILRVEAGHVSPKLNNRYRELRRECYETNIVLPKLGLVDLTFGNASVIDRAKGVFAIKPAGVPYSELSPDSMILLDMKGRQLEGKFQRSSDAAIHYRLFEGFPEIRAIVHTHSRNAVSFAQAGKGIPCFRGNHTEYFHGEVPVTRPMTAREIRKDYDWATGNVILERFSGLNPQSIPGVLLHGHGPYAWGPNGAEAVENALALELAAEVALKAFHMAGSHSS